MQVAAAVPVKLARPVTEIKTAAVDDAPVNPTVMEVEVDLTVLDNDKAPVSYMAGTVTPLTESRAVAPPPAANVEMVEMVAAAAVLGVVRPVMTHETTTLSAVAVVTVMAKLGVVYKTDTAMLVPP